MRLPTSWLQRLFDKIVHDALPAVLATVIGGLLVAHFQLDRAPGPATIKVMPASAEMMQLLRDEHGLMANFVNARVANERNQVAGDQWAQRAAPAGPPVQAASPVSGRF